jgi:hypothetical protein
VDNLIADAASRTFLVPTAFSSRNISAHHHTCNYLQLVSTLCRTSCCSCLTRILGFSYNLYSGKTILPFSLPSWLSTSLIGYLGSLHLIAAMFVFYMSTHKKDGSPLISATIDGYVSHVMFTSLTMVLLIYRLPLPSTSWLLQALTLQDAQRLLSVFVSILLCLLPIFISVLFKTPSCFLVSLPTQFITAAMYLVLP